jgi:hypothetical protein
MASTDPVKDVRQIMAGTVTTPSIKNAYLSGAKDGTAAFQGALAEYKAVRAAELPAPVPVQQFVPAPLSDASGYARAKTACTAWGNGQTRNPAAGEVFKIIKSTQPPTGGVLSDLGYSADNRPILALMPLNGETRALYLYVDCLEGMKPA